jgi:hypothetical protein
MAREALVKQAPQPPASITEPDHLRRTQDALAHRFKPQTGREHLDVPQDRHQPTLRQPRDDLPGPRALLAQAGEHAHFDFAPARFPRGCPGRGPKRDQHAIGPQGQGQSRPLGCQWLGHRPMALGHGGQVFLEVLHSLVASRLHPTPDGSGTDGAPDVPAEQPGRSGKGHKNR